MLLAGIFLAAFARSLAIPISANDPNGPIPSPICVVAAALTTSKCETAKFRSIFDILWSCIGTILLCTYISVHHNIPDRNDSWSKVMWTKVRTTLYALLAPEVVIMWAMRQRMMAEKIAEANKNRDWTKTHGFFVQMGGLMLEVEKGRRYQTVGWSTTEDAFVRGRLGQHGDVVIYKLPTISEREIRDHGKGDFLAKAIVVLQTTWFVIQCIARHYEGLTLTELELVTLAFAALNIITYMLWWDKPLNVGYPIYFNLDGNRVDGPSDFTDPGRWNMDWYGGIAFRWSTQEQSTEPGIWARLVDEFIPSVDSAGMFILTFLWLIIAGPFYFSFKGFIAAFSPLLEMTNKEDSGRDTSVGPFYAAYLTGKDHDLAYIYSSAIGVIFGAIHLVGWNFTFITKAELWLWRSSSLVLTVIPFFMALSQSFRHAYRKTGGTLHDIFDSLDDMFWWLTINLGSPLYIAARVIVLFMAFFSLRLLPDSAYQNIQWTEFIPHI